MESARTQLRRALPNLAVIDGSYTSYGSTYEKRISKKHLRHWDTFIQEVRDTIQNNGTELNLRIIAENAAPENTIVSNEIGLQGRFMQNVGQIMGKVFCRSSKETLKQLRFHDAQVNDDVRTQIDHDPITGNKRKRSIPDVIISAVLPNETTTPRIVGEIKTYWTAPIHHVDVASRKNLAILEPHLGQLVNYMRFLGLRYGFLTTYLSTIYVQRTDILVFQISEPISHNAIDPSVRECFYHLGTLSTHANYTFVDDLGDAPELQIPGRSLATDKSPGIGQSLPGESVRTNEGPSLLSSSDAPSGYTAAKETIDNLGKRNEPHRRAASVSPASQTTSVEPSPVFLTSQEAEPSSGSDTSQTVSLEPAPTSPASQPISVELITSRTTFFGRDGYGNCRVDLIKLIRESDTGKKVYEAVENGRKVIVKFWPEDAEHSFFGFDNELRVYRDLLPPSEFIPKLVGYGRVILSKDLEEGNILVMQKEEGQVFSRDVWDRMEGKEKDDFRMKLRSALEYLRANGVVQGDTRKDNVLWDAKKKRIILLDLETVFEKEDDEGIDGMEYDCILNMEFL